MRCYEERRNTLYFPPVYMVSTMSKTTNTNLVTSDPCFFAQVLRKFCTDIEEGYDQQYQEGNDTKKEMGQ